MSGLLEYGTSLPTGCFDFDGQPISMLEWGELLGAPDARVGDAYIGRVRIATDWTGYDLKFTRGMRPRPLIYETMIFPRRERDVNARWVGMKWQYATRAEALAGHIALVNRIRSRGVQSLLTQQRAEFRELIRGIIDAVEAAKDRGEL